MQKRIPDSSYEMEDENAWSRVASDLAPQLNRQLNTVVTLVKEYPAASLGVAAGLGLVIGWWMKRK